MIGCTFCVTVMSFGVKRLIINSLINETTGQECLTFMQHFDRTRYIIAYLVIFCTFLVLWPFSTSFLKGRKSVVKKFFAISGESAVPLQNKYHGFTTKRKTYPFKGFLEKFEKHSWKCGKKYFTGY